MAEENFHDVKRQKNQNDALIQNNFSSAIKIHTLKQCNKVHHFKTNVQFFYVHSEKKNFFPSLLFLSSHAKSVCVSTVSLFSFFLFFFPDSKNLVFLILRCSFGSFQLFSQIVKIIYNNRHFYIYIYIYIYTHTHTHFFFTCLCVLYL